MAMTPEAQNRCARFVCNQAFPPGTTATFHFGHALAAVQAVDAALDVTLNQAVVAVGGGVTVINALAMQIPAPWNTGSAAQQALIGVAVFMGRGGLI